jgi:diguanylate cyclase (GGDEF)-like protein
VRVRRFHLAALAYGACLPLLGLAHLLGLLSLHALLGAVLLMAAANALLFWLFHSGLNERFADPSLTWLQVVTGTMVIMYVAYHVDSNRGLVLMLSLVVLAFGTFRFTTREFLLAAGMVLAGYAAVVNLLFWHKPDSVNVLLEGFQWVVLAFVLPCFALVGGRLSELRARLRRANDELTSALSTIQQMATHDTLTALPNRALFGETLTRAVAQAARGRRNLALFFLDLDRFKNINDTLGHGVGDRVLREAAQRLQATVRAGDMVARLGGDEFVLLVNDYDAHASLAETATRVLAAFAPTLTVDGTELGLAASIGICVYPEDGDDAQTLVSNADVAMYRAKEQGRNRFCFYSADMNHLSQERLSLEVGLRHALARNEIEVFYQPKIAFGHGRVTGVEALIRWRHADLGLISPDRFVPLAEETGDIIAIGYWTMRQVCERARRWQSQGMSLTVAVNLCASQFHDPALLATLAGILKATGVSPETLEIEITETMVMKDVERAVAVMENLRRMGVGLAIDDFGTGHSSLGYLKRFPINQLKVDRSFVRDLPHNSDDVAITRAVIAMAHSLEMTVVAEGVEHQSQFDLLRAEGCDEFQGYYCRPAMPEAELMQFLAEERASRAPSALRPSLATSP